MTGEDAIRRAEQFIEDATRRQEVARECVQKNECPGCGAFRYDGHPPEVHEHDCPYESDSLDRTMRRMFGSSPTGEPSND